MDLRRIPYILGTLYGGWPLGACFCLYFTAALANWRVRCRVFINTNFSSDFIHSFIFHNKILFTFFIKNRIIVSTCLSIIGSLLAMLVSIFILRVTSIPIGVWVQFAILDVVGMFVITILWEAIRANLLVLQRLMKAEKLEIVSHLAASISHEVRNPLTASRGFMQMLQEDEKEPAKNATFPLRLMN
ncbi:histidine kinase dimerization/phospho-acceptor domain-containing protein [Priestia megaterium]